MTINPIITMLATFAETKDLRIEFNRWADFPKSVTVGSSVEVSLGFSVLVEVMAVVVGGNGDMVVGIGGFGGLNVVLLDMVVLRQYAL